MRIARRYVVVIMPSKKSNVDQAPRYLRLRPVRFEEGLEGTPLFKTKGQAQQALMASRRAQPLRNMWWVAKIARVPIETSRGKVPRLMVDDMEPGEFLEILRALPPAR